MNIGFNIQCGWCHKVENVEEGYNNTDSINLKIIGEQIIEISCKKCGSKITTIDGEL